MTVDSMLELAASAKSAIVSSAAILIAVFVYFGISRYLKVASKKETITPPATKVLRKTTRWIVLIFAFLMVLQQFGLLENVWTAVAAAFAMVAIGFVAVWSVMSNVLCTLLILTTRPFRIGDEVSFPGEEISGRVIDLGLLFTTLRDSNGDLVQIPNNHFFQKPLKRTPGQAPVTLWDQLSKREPMDQDDTN